MYTTDSGDELANEQQDESNLAVYKCECYVPSSILIAATLAESKAINDSGLSVLEITCVIFFSLQCFSVSAFHSKKDGSGHFSSHVLTH